MAKTMYGYIYLTWEESCMVWNELLSVSKKFCDANSNIKVLPDEVCMERLKVWELDMEGLSLFPTDSQTRQLSHESFLYRSFVMVSEGAGEQCDPDDPSVHKTLILCVLFWEPMTTFIVV